MKKTTFPNRITIELTNRCNAACTFCHRQDVSMKIGDMEESLYYKIIDEAAAHLPVAVVLFFRGESLLVDKLVEYIQYAKNKGIGPIQLASNGMALTNDLADRLIESGLDFMSFSLDTMDSQVYKESRKVGDLKVAIDNVVYMSRRCKERRQRGEKAPELQVSTIDMDIYRNTQEEFISFWKQHVDTVRVYYEHDDKGRLVDKSLWDSLLSDNERKPCKKVFNDFIIYWDGRVALCNYDWDEKTDLGDVTKQSISEIWNSDIFEEIRREHNSGQITGNLMCKECQHWRMSYTKEGFWGKAFKAEDKG